MRIAFAGSSGTGKTTLATWLAAEVGAPLCPVGSRSTALAMGLVRNGEPDPYLADERGVRREFQEKLLADKVAWEAEAAKSLAGFVTDRTTLDNATYTIMHQAGNDPRGLAAYLATAVEAMRRYDVVFYCPAEAFMKIGGDAARVGGRDGEALTEADARAYHDAFNVLLFALLLRHYPNMTVLSTEGLEDRKAAIRRRLRL